MKIFTNLPVLKFFLTEAMFSLQLPSISYRTRFMDHFINPVEEKPSGEAGKS
jgi:hypothetical protein